MSLSWYGASGKFPEIQFRRLVDRIERPVPPNAEIVTAFTDGQVTLRSNRDKVGYHEAADLSSFRGVEPGDLVVHGLDILRGSVGVSDSRGAISAVCTVAVTREQTDSRYIAYAIRAQAQSGFTRALARGIREGGADFRRWDTLAELPIPLPPVEEQRRIADFLDDQVARIDKLINAHERLRYLSSEQFESERHAWVSGSDPRGTSDLAGENPLQWIESPALGWQTTRLAAHFNFRKGRDSQRLTKEFITAHPGPYPVYSGQTANDGVFGFLDTYDFDLGQGAILIATVGSVATIGTRMVSGKCSLSQNCALIIPRVGVTNAQVRFTEYQLKSILQVRLSEVPQHMQTSLRLADLAGYRLVLPDPSRVSRIVDELDRRAAWCATVAVECGTAIARLEERKRALITAAVTGELDVTTARPIGMGKWVPNVGAGVEASAAAQASSIGGIG